MSLSEGTIDILFGQWAVKEVTPTDLKRLKPCKLSDQETLWDLHKAYTAGACDAMNHQTISDPKGPDCAPPKLPADESDQVTVPEEMEGMSHLEIARELHRRMENLQRYADNLYSAAHAHLQHKDLTVSDRKVFKFSIQIAQTLQHLMNGASITDENEPDEEAAP